MRSDEKLGSQRRCPVTGLVMPSSNCLSIGRWPGSSAPFLAGRVAVGECRGSVTLQHKVQPPNHRLMCHTSPRFPGQRRAGFSIHLMKYVLVIAGLWLTWALTGAGHPWPIYPTLGWGLDVLGPCLRAGRPVGLRTTAHGARRPLAPAVRGNRYTEAWNDQWVDVHEVADPRAERPPLPAVASGNLRNASQVPGRGLPSA